MIVYFFHRQKKDPILSDSDDNFKPSKKPPQPTRKYLHYDISTCIFILQNVLECFFAATSEELFDSLVGNSSPEKQQKSSISSSREGSPVKFPSPKKGN